MLSSYEMSHIPGGIQLAGHRKELESFTWELKIKPRLHRRAIETKEYAHVPDVAGSICAESSVSLFVAMSNIIEN